MALLDIMTLVVALLCSSHQATAGGIFVPSALSVVHMQLYRSSSLGSVGIIKPSGPGELCCVALPWLVFLSIRLFICHSNRQANY